MVEVKEGGPFSIRMRPELLEQVEAYGRDRSLSRNAAIVALCEEGLVADQPGPLAAVRPDPRRVLRAKEAAVGVAPPKIEVAGGSAGRSEVISGRVPVVNLNEKRPAYQKGLPKPKKGRK